MDKYENVIAYYCYRCGDPGLSSIDIDDYGYVFECKKCKLTFEVNEIEVKHD